MGGWGGSGIFFPLGCRLHGHHDARFETHGQGHTRRIKGTHAGRKGHQNRRPPTCRRGRGLCKCLYEGNRRSSLEVRSDWQILRLLRHRAKPWYCSILQCTLTSCVGKNRTIRTWQQSKIEWLLAFRELIKSTDTDSKREEVCRKTIAYKTNVQMKYVVSSSVHRWRWSHGA